MFAVYWSSLWAAVRSLAWIVGRVVYFIDSIRDPESRFIGMSIQAAAAFAPVFGTLGRIVYLLA